VGLQQRVEILKALAQESEIIILDEPTAVLTPQEVEALFSNLRRLRDMGKTIIIITHKLKEVMSITDKVTVLRQGTVVAERKTSETNLSELAELMIGHKLAETPERSSGMTSKKTLRLQNLNAQLNSHSIEDISFDVHAAEIVGIAGVEGNGQDVLIHSLLDPSALNKNSLSGKIFLTDVVGIKR
jgi:simple sugar transport system ATP-binding protein